MGVKSVREGFVGTRDQAETWEYGQVREGLCGDQGPGRHLAVGSGREGLVGSRVDVDTWQYGQVLRGLWRPGTWQTLGSTVRS